MAPTSVERIEWANQVFATGTLDGLSPDELGTPRRRRFRRSTSRAPSSTAGINIVDLLVTHGHRRLARARRARASSKAARTSTTSASATSNRSSPPARSSASSSARARRQEGAAPRPRDLAVRLHVRACHAHSPGDTNELSPATSAGDFIFGVGCDRTRRWPRRPRRGSQAMSCAQKGSIMTKEIWFETCRHSAVRGRER